MRGKITLQIRKRKINTSKAYKDKWSYSDTIYLYSDKDIFFTLSKNYLKKFKINKDELAFIKLIFLNYGPGDYNILMLGKGKMGRGYRRFWDGIITIDRKFVRRKNNLLSTSLYDSSSMAYNTDFLVGKYFKTKKPGIWHSF